MSDRSFTFSLNAKTWWRPFLGLYVVLLFALILFEFSWMRFIPKPTATDQLFSAFSFTGFLFLVFCASNALAVYLSTRIIPAISIDGSALVFKGESASLAGLVLKGSLFSVLSAGLYIPRFIKLVAEYFARKTRYRDERFMFAGSAEKLLKKYIPGVFLPAVAWIILSSCVSLALKAPAKGSPNLTLFDPVGATLTLGLFALFLISLSPFLAALFIWLCDIRWENKRVGSTAEMKVATVHIAIQLGLSVLTLGIYLPAATINIWRSLIGTIHIMEEKKPKYRIYFKGKTFSGFFYLWGQTLLCLVSFGIYTPWACARILRFFITNTGVADC